MVRTEIFGLFLRQKTQVEDRSNRAIATCVAMCSALKKESQVEIGRARRETHGPLALSPKMPKRGSLVLTCAFQFGHGSSSK